jgi:hypothetical protein
MEGSSSQHGEFSEEKAEGKPLTRFSATPPGMRLATLWRQGRPDKPLGPPFARLEKHCEGKEETAVKKKRGSWAAGLVGLALVLPPVAGSANETSGENCGTAIERQFEHGVTAGGGPKSGVINEQTGLLEVPTNCDHFWQAIGAIGPDK